MYIALRAMKVQSIDRNMRQVKPGDPVPEAEFWKNRKAYENRQWIAQNVAVASEHTVAGAIATATASRDEEIDRLTKELEVLRHSALSELVDDVHVQYSEAPVDEADDTEASDEAPVDEASINEALVDDAPVAEDPKLSKAELKAMAKPSLQAIADDLGVNPDQAKAKLVDGILEAQ